MPMSPGSCSPWMDQLQQALATADKADLQALRPRLLDASHDPA
ncbi:hypothetical protein [Pseudomonas peli]